MYIGRIVLELKADVSFVKLRGRIRTKCVFLSLKNRLGQLWQKMRLAGQSSRSKWPILVVYVKKSDIDWA
jgi:hypothetical protein